MAAIPDSQATGGKVTAKTQPRPVTRPGHNGGCERPSNRWDTATPSSVPTRPAMSSPTTAATRRRMRRAIRTPAGNTTSTTCTAVVRASRHAVGNVTTASMNARSEVRTRAWANCGDQQGDNQNCQRQGEPEYIGGRGEWGTSLSASIRTPVLS